MREQQLFNRETCSHRPGKEIPLDDLEPCNAILSQARRPNHPIFGNDCRQFFEKAILNHASREP